MFAKKSVLKSVLAATTGLSLFAILGACGSADNSGGTRGKGSVVFHITDAPVDSAKHVFITVASLEISKEGQGEDAGGWIKIPLEKSEEFDLLALQNGASSPLAALPELEAGKYGQIRLKLDSQKPPRIVLEDDSSHELFIPSAAKTGIKLVSGFEIKPDEKLELTIDFDLRKSIIEKGSARASKLPKATRDEAGNSSYLMKPTLRLVKNVLTGKLEGASDSQVVCAYKVDAVKDTTTDCDGAVAAAKVNDGKFVVAFLEAGDYSLRFFKIEGEQITHEDKDGPFTVKAGESTQIE